MAIVSSENHFSTTSRREMGQQLTPDWDIIKDALNSLFANHDISVDSLGQSRRLQYDDFEKVFYHLFTIIDPAECRRKFWSKYPARNRDEQTEFINNVAVIINSSQLIPNRISASQLRTFGGEPFRRIIVALILKATEIESAKLTERLETTSEQTKETSLDEYYIRLDKSSELLKKNSKCLDDLVKKFHSYNETYSELEDDIQQKWLALMGIDEQLDISEDNVGHNKKTIFKSLLSKLEISMRKRESATKAIMAFRVEVEPHKSRLNSPEKKSADAKRISEYFVNLKRRLLASPEYSPDTVQSRLINKISQRLVEYETGVDQICLDLEAEKEEAYKRTYEEIMSDPELEERYRSLENLVPSVDLKQIDFESSTMEEIDMGELRNILSTYPDSRYDVADDEEIVDHFVKNIL